LAEALGTHLKVNATGGKGDACWFLYDHCQFPRQYQKEGNALTDRLASDDEALIKIYVKTKDKRALAFLKLRRLLTQTRTLTATADADGRIRCAYNLVGTETARLTCYESPTGSGFNLQTVSKPFRHLFQADEGCLLAQCDLAGADGWTVAAYAQMLGDPTMMEDYKAKLKPAQIGVLMHYQGPAINKLSRDQLYPLCKPIKEETHWEYFAFKRVQHGSSYMMGPVTMSDQILTDSFKKNGKPIVVPPAVCKQMQETCFFTRYPGIKRWHTWMAQELKRTGSLTASNGFRRLFYGRKDDKSTLKAALAHLPQVYTTASTMLALHRCWHDPENRRGDGSLIVEPLHSVHDSLITQFKEADKDWAKQKIRTWFDNVMVIAGQPIVIPFEGAMGRDWKHLDDPI
jgi:DNA polymerase I-like protein with 3'-5' exonuclease and polymerase domains